MTERRLLGLGAQLQSDADEARSQASSKKETEKARSRELLEEAQLLERSEVKELLQLAGGMLAAGGHPDAELTITAPSEVANCEIPTLRLAWDFHTQHVPVYSMGDVEVIHTSNEVNAMVNRDSEGNPAGFLIFGRDWLSDVKMTTAIVTNGTEIEAAVETAVLNPCRRKETTISNQSLMKEKRKTIPLNSQPKI